MSRHLADRPRDHASGPRLKHFLRLERAESPHPAVRALHARRPAAPAEGRLAAVLRLLRGRPG